MRRILTGIAVAVVASHAALAAQSPRQIDNPASLQRTNDLSWAKRAHLSPIEATAAIEAAATAEGTPNRPIVLVETNYYTFLPNEKMQLRITTNANGFGAPVTMYLYQENRRTGERRYYNAAAKTLLAAGQQADLFGAVGSVAPIVVPQLSDFILFGTAGEELGFGAGALGTSITVPANQTGLYQWVVELRDAAGKRVVSRSNAMYSCIEASQTVTGTITSSTTWTANRRYVLSDFVGVASGATLTIEPGTVIYGGNARATLFIQRGAKIIADGTARRPIIFTSAQKVGSRAQRDWGSLVVLGAAPLNEVSGQAFLEGLPSQPAYSYGGTNASDNSGIIRYVRLEFGGFEIEANQEINGLTLAGVGNGTIVDYVEVLQNKDDAFEFFGGTVNAKHLLGVGFADDGLDFDLGYSGSIQYAALIKRGVNDENDGNILSESDNHPSNFTLTPTTNPKVYNVTGFGTGRTDLGNYGAVLRRGTGSYFGNIITTGSRHAPVTVRDAATFTNVSNGALNIESSILHGDFADAKFPNSSDRSTQTRDFVLAAAKRNRNTDPMLAIGAPAPIKTLMPDLTPLSGSPALDADFVATIPDNGFLEQTDFIGAVKPGDNWVLSGWANFSDN